MHRRLHETTAAVRPSRPGTVAAFFALGATYAVLAVLGSRWATVSGAASPVWPAAGVALAGLFLQGLRLWPAVLIGGFCAFLLTGSAHPWWLDLLLSAGNALAAALAAAGLRRVRFAPDFGRAKDALALIGIGAVGAAAVAATLGAAALWAFVPLDATVARLTWYTWFLGDMVGVLTTAALVLSWGASPLPRSARWWTHHAACLAASAAVGWAAFIANAEARPIAWYAFVPLLWAAFAFGARAMVALALLSALAVWGTTVGTGPFSTHDLGPWRYLMLQQFIAVAAGTTLVVAALASERQGKDVLQATEERLRVALSAGKMGVWSWNPASGKASWDAALEQLTGVSAQDGAEVAADDFFARVHPDDSARTQAQARRAFLEGSQYAHEFRFTRPDGQVIWLASYAAAVRNAEGRVTHLTGVSLDISERKRADESVRQSEALFRALADSAPAMIWVAEPDGSCSFLSRGWYEFTGQARHEALGFGWTSAIHPDDRKAVAQRFREADAGHEPFAREYRVRTAGGEYRWVLDVGRPRASASGEHLGFVGNVLDVTDRKLAEEALRASEERSRRQLQELDTLYQTAPIGMWLGDDACRFLRVNEVLAKAHGRTVEAHIGKTFREVVPQLADVVEPHYRRVLETGEPLPGFEVTGRAPDQPDVERTWVVSFYPLSGASGEVIAVSGIVQDITEHKRATAALREADRRKDEYLATLAHELRNPLAPVRTGLQLLRKAPAGSPAAASARDMMERQVQHMVRLIDDLLDVSRISRGKVDLRRERVGLDAIVELALEASRPYVEAGRHRLAVRLPPEPVFLEADAARLAQVISNLLNNAAKYTPEGGRIELAVEREGHEAVIRVTDTGVGIAPDMLARVFEMFTQVGRTIDRSQGGLGIGLSLVRQLVELHGGTVQAASPGPGLGSTFVVRLPLAAMRLSDFSAGDQRQ